MSNIGKKFKHYKKTGYNAPYDRIIINADAVIKVESGGENGEYTMIYVQGLESAIRVDVPFMEIQRDFNH